MFCHLSQAGIKDVVWYEIYHTKIKDKDDPLYKLVREYWRMDGYYYDYSSKVRELSVMLGNYCMEEMFSFLVEIKQYKILHALEVLGIIPTEYLVELKYNKYSLVSPKANNYKHILTSLTFNI